MRRCLSIWICTCISNADFWVIACIKNCVVYIHNAYPWVLFLQLHIRESNLWDCPPQAEARTAALITLWLSSLETSHPSATLQRGHWERRMAVGWSALWTFLWGTTPACLGHATNLSSRNSLARRSKRSGTDRTLQPSSPLHRLFSRAEHWWLMTNIWQRCLFTSYLCLTVIFDAEGHHFLFAFSSQVIYLLSGKKNWP